MLDATWLTQRFINCIGGLQHVKQKYQRTKSSTVGRKRNAPTNGAAGSFVFPGGICLLFSTVSHSGYRCPQRPQAHHRLLASKPLRPWRVPLPANRQSKSVTESQRTFWRLKSEILRRMASFILRFVYVPLLNDETILGFGRKMFTDYEIVCRVR